MRLIALLFAAEILASAQVPTIAPNGQQTAFGRVQAQSQPPQPTSFDCAADGSVVNSVTGEPIPRARVSMTVPPGTSYAAVADASGRWNFSNVACGPLQLVVTRPGFFQKSRRPMSLLTLVSGSPLHDVKTELTPQSVFYGKVVDEQGDPLMGAQIEVLDSYVVGGRPGFRRTGGGSTNDLGEYRVAGLQRGKYVLCAHANQQPEPAGLLTKPETMTGMSCYPGVPAEGSANAMEVAPGRETKVDFTLTQVPAMHVRGSVAGLPEGRNFGISLTTRGAVAGLGNTGGTSVRGGKFDFRVMAGSYMLTGDYFEGGKRLLARVPIEVGSSDIDNVVVNLDSGFTVTGHVRMESQTKQSSSRSQLNMNLRPVEQANATTQVRWDADRTSFTFNEMVPGTYRLDLLPPPPFYVKSATLAGQDILGTEFSVAQAAGPVEIVLRDDGGSIEGDVVGADGQPASGSVMAIRNSRDVTGPSNGHFKLQNLAPGDYQVYAWDDPSQVEYANPEWMRRYGGGGVTVTVAAGQSAQVKLTLQTAQ